MLVRVCGMGIYVHQGRGYGIKGGAENRAQVLCKSSVCSEPLSCLHFPRLLGSKLHVHSLRAPSKCSLSAFLGEVSHFVSNYRSRDTSVENGAPSQQVRRYNPRNIESWSAAASEFCGGWDSDFATGLWHWGRRGPHRAPSWLTSVVTKQRVRTMSARCSVLSIHSSRILDHGGGLCGTNHKNNSCLKESQNSDRQAKSNSGTRSIRCQVSLFLNGPLIRNHYTSYTVRRLFFRSVCAV